MAERRMFAKTIIDSDAFMDMPLSSQCLYFHLSMRADDEGFINNPKKIQRMIGASDDDLKLLEAKKFIIPFESGVVVIKHWKIHNYIRGDRLHPTKYTEEKSSLFIKENGAYTLSSDACQSNVSQLDGNLDTEVRLGKDSLGEVNLFSSKNTAYYQKIIDTYHKNCPSLPKVTKLTEARKKLIDERLNEYSEEELEKIFCEVESSDYLTGRNTKWRGANFDWVMESNNIVRILGGYYKYKNQTEKKSNEYKQYKHGNYDFAAMEAELRRK